MCDGLSSFPGHPFSCPQRGEPPSGVGGTDLRGKKSHRATTAMITTVTTIWIILTVGVRQGSLGLIEGAETKKRDAEGIHSYAGDF